LVSSGKNKCLHKYPPVDKIVSLAKNQWLNLLNNQNLKETLMKKILCSVLMAALILSTLPFNLSAATVVPGGEPDPATVKAALAEFKNLSKAERKERVKAVKKEWKEFKKENKGNKTKKVDQIVLIILAILLPPLAVYLHQGEVNGRFWLSLLLWFLFILPGVIYALLVVTDSV